METSRKLIIAEYRTDTFYRASSIPFVLFSTHPRYIEGCRFDYGFLQIALSEGYAVQILQPEPRILLDSQPAI